MENIHLEKLVWDTVEDVLKLKASKEQRGPRNSRSLQAVRPASRYVTGIKRTNRHGHKSVASLTCAMWGRVSSLEHHLIRRFAPPSPQGEGMRAGRGTGFSLQSTQATSMLIGPMLRMGAETMCGHKHSDNCPFRFLTEYAIITNTTERFPD